MMTLDHGLMDGQVLQRDRRNRGRASIRGRCDATGLVEVRLQGHHAHPLTRWTAIGRAAGGVFKAVILDMPAGGPYRLDFRIRNKSARESLSGLSFYVGDVWFLAGQSNMQGFGSLAEAAPPHPQVRCFYLDDTWGLARDPLHFIPSSVDPVHHRLRGRIGPLSPAQLAAERAALLKGAGVGLPFARRMAEWTGVPQGLVACAHGGSRMAQWSPVLSGEGGQSLYGAMLRRYGKLGQKAAGMLWYQGESDAHAAALPLYTPRMIELVAAVRRDFRQPGLPWLVAQLGRHVVDDPPADWNAIQELQRKLPEVIRRMEVVPTSDLELDDPAHISARGFDRLADRFYRAARHLAFGDRGEKGAIRFRGVSLVTRRLIPGSPSTSVEVAFDNVSGSLCAAGLPRGFSAVAPDGSPTEVFFRTTLAGPVVKLETIVNPVLFETLDLHYGRGRNPAVTITDERGMGLPSFGPIPISVVRGTRFVLTWRVARIGDSGLPVGNMKIVPDVSGGWTPAVPGTASSAFMVFPEPINQKRDGTFLFRCVVKAKRACRVRLLMGADSPFRTWLNGRPVLGDGHAANPCIPGEYQSTAALRKGPNTIDTAFDTRHGKGWGISLRFGPMGRARSFPDGLLTW